MKIKKILSAGLFVLSSVNAMAADEGFYFGGQIGQGTLQPGTQTLSTGSGTVQVGANNSGAAGRVYAGLQGNRYFGLETGYTYYSSPRYKDLPATICGQPYIRLQTWDLQAKGIFPFLNTLINAGLEGFVQGGIAAAWVSKAGSLQPVVDSSGCGYTISTVKALPIAGFGLSYDVTQNIVVDLFFSRLFSTDRTTVPNANFLGLGISYHAVSLKCGQFLC